MKIVIINLLIILFIPFLANLLAIILLFIWGIGDSVAGFDNIMGPFLAMFQGFLGAVLVMAISKKLHGEFIYTRVVIIGLIIWSLFSLSLTVYGIWINIDGWSWGATFSILSLISYPVGWGFASMDEIKKLIQFHRKLRD